MQPGTTGDVIYWTEPMATATHQNLHTNLTTMFGQLGSNILDVYQHQPNYQVVVTDAASTTAAIYFSSNGIYLPDTFEKRIVQKNRFDWQRNLLPEAGTHIFVRDILKQWYVRGINAEVNSPSLLIHFCKISCRNITVLQ